MAKLHGVFQWGWNPNWDDPPSGKSKEAKRGKESQGPFRRKIQKKKRQAGASEGGVMMASCPRNVQ